VTDTVTWSEGALEAVNVLALATGVAYAVLAARRNRLCWILGAVSSAASVLLAATGKLPMLAGLYAFYVGMSVYGWVSWKRGTREDPVRTSCWSACGRWAGTWPQHWC
jgi:nicotinamide mononucleotide transporter